MRADEQRHFNEEEERRKLFREERRKEEQRTRIEDVSLDAPMGYDQISLPSLPLSPMTLPHSDSLEDIWINDLDNWGSLDILQEGSPSTADDLYPLFSHD